MINFRGLKVAIFVLAAGFGPKPTEMGGVKSFWTKNGQTKIDFFGITLYL